VHQPGIGNLIKLSSADNLTNIKIIPHDALEVLQFMIKDNFLSKINIFFPDPWHKKRHNKRRLVNEDNLNLIIKKLKDGGVLHIATDWEPYALEIIDVIKTSDNLTLNTNNFHERPDFRPETKYESRGMRLGHAVWDILATKG
jgi:tRNA (guanine-N7-)-methyltransferase